MTDITSTASPAWMTDDRRNCAIPPQYDTPRTIGVFADQWVPPSPINERAATVLCRDCPFSVQCATYAIERPELEGVWGGTTTAERGLLRADGAVA